ncbi:MAG: peptide chain release factor H [Micrococcales bacterium]|nr:peptide chain release factor H [Micrococcales bacterium]
MTTMQPGQVLLQLSSGQGGPAECEIAVGKLVEALSAEFDGVEVVDSTPGRGPGAFRSVRLWGPAQMAGLEGSVLWVCASPVRPHHGRKNWYVDVAVAAHPGPADEFDPRKVRFETFRSPGRGGQHVNTTDSGVRAVYLPTGDQAVSTDERSQHMNRRTATARLRQTVERRAHDAHTQAAADNWREHHQIVRGDPVRVYRGPQFTRTT